MVEPNTDDLGVYIAVVLQDRAIVGLRKVNKIWLVVKGVLLLGCKSLAWFRSRDVALRRPLAGLHRPRARGRRSSPLVLGLRRGVVITREVYDLVRSLLSRRHLVFGPYRKDEMA